MTGPYAELSREELEARLAAAEDVCLLYSWTGTTAGAAESDREKALFEVWRVWWEQPGIPVFAHTAHRAWPESRIEELARQRDKTRADTLARIHRLTEPEGPQTP